MERASELAANLFSQFLSGPQLVNASILQMNQPCIMAALHRAAKVVLPPVMNRFVLISVATPMVGSQISQFGKAGFPHGVKMKDSPARRKGAETQGLSVASQNHPLGAHLHLSFPRHLAVPYVLSLSRCQAVEARPNRPPRREERGGITVLVARLLFIFISNVTLMVGSQTSQIGKSRFPPPCQFRSEQPPSPPLAVTMQLEMGSTPAPGVPTRCPPRAPPSSVQPLKGESKLRATNVTGEGASHDARGGRGPHELHRSGLGPEVTLPTTGSQTSAP
jgi:hypothetical protein